MTAAQIDDGGDAEFLQLRITGSGRLCAAKEMVVYFAGVFDAENLNFFAMRK